MRARVRNPTASLKARLAQLAIRSGLPNQQVVEQFARERLLYRLSRSSFRDKFILKGATLFSIWTGATHRPTHDLDFLSFEESDVESMVEIFRRLCEEAPQEEGIVFPAERVKGEQTRPDEEYQGVKIRLIAKMDRSEYTVRIDVGFGDAVVPPAEFAQLPTLLDGFAAPQMRIYPREVAIAEKLHAMVEFGMSNGRLKDYFDIWYLATHFDFDGSVLAAAITATFQRRAIPLPGKIPVALTATFAKEPSRQTMWANFAKESQGAATEAPPLSAITTYIAGFLMPPILAAQDEKPFKQWWHHTEGCWRDQPSDKPTPEGFPPPLSKG